MPVHILEPTRPPLLIRLGAFWQALDPAWKFALGAFAAARILFTAWSLVILYLFPVVVQNLDLFGAPVLAVISPASGERFAYSRQVNGVVLTFTRGQPGQVVDNQTTSVWSLSDGRAVAGPRSGQTLSSSPIPVEDIFPYKGVAPESNPLLAVWQRFDANWYLAIAANGYGRISGDVNYLPLYPLLIRMAGSSFAGALLISNLALIVALALLYRMTREHFDSDTARRAVALLLLFPTAFFFFSAYNQGLFLLAALLALRAMERRAWLLAGFWTFSSILLRLQGIALLAPLLYALWSARPRDKKLAAAMGLALPGLAVLVYLLNRAAVRDGALVPFTEAIPPARLAPPWDNVIYAVQTLASGRFAIADLVNLILTALFVAALAAGWRKLSPLLLLYSLASLLVLMVRLVDTQPLNSMSRYLLSLFPVLMLFGCWTHNSWLQRAFVYPSLALSLFLSAQFFLWGWVA